MVNQSNRFVYLDNIRIFMVFNVVLYHSLLMFAYPMLFWWPVVDKSGSSRVYESLFFAMSIYMMPMLMFIAALFIFPSLKEKTTLTYIKKRFLRLYLPVIVYLLCAGDIAFNILSKRLTGINQTYMETFINFWREFITLNAVNITPGKKLLNEITFSQNHTWFLSFLFVVTFITVFISILFKKKTVEQKNVNSAKKIIIQTIMFAVIISALYTVIAIIYTSNKIKMFSWIDIHGFVAVMVDQFWSLIFVFIFGLYMYKKEWLTKGDIGGWKLWGSLSLVLLFLYIRILNTGYLQVVDQIMKVLENNMSSENKLPAVVLSESFKRSVLIQWFMLNIACIFILMFVLSFAKQFFNRSNMITTFCAKHSINVYILHLIPVILLQFTFLNVPLAPVAKILVIFFITVPACLWLSHKLVYPHPGAAIGFFVILKLIALSSGFTFYYYALIAITLISFAFAVYESARLLILYKKGY